MGEFGRNLKIIPKSALLSFTILYQKVTFELKINSYMPGNIKGIFSIVNQWIKMDLVVFLQHEILLTAVESAECTST